MAGYEIKHLNPNGSVKRVTIIKDRDILGVTPLIALIVVAVLVVMLR